MTSHANHEATESFRKHKFFDLGEETVKFFRQGRMPAVDFDGRILMGIEREDSHESRWAWRCVERRLTEVGRSRKWYPKG